MTVVEIKEQIKQGLNEVPETSLNDVLKFINQLKQKTLVGDRYDQHLKKILEEDHELLKRLAQ
ncbi:hypothetical protein [Mucilaginibacter sp.]